MRPTKFADGYLYRRTPLRMRQRADRGMSLVLTLLFIFLAPAMLLGALVMGVQSVVGAGLPGNRAGIDALLQRVKCKSNIDGAAANNDITVAGVSVGDTVLSVIAGDGTDLGASDVTVTAANTIRCTVNTGSKKLTVIWIDESSGQASRGTEQTPAFGLLDTLFGVKIRASVVAGANGAITVTGLATADSILAIFCTDATIDLSGSTWAVTTNTLTPTASINTTGKHVVVLWIDESASSASNGTDHNTNLGHVSADSINRLIKGLRISSAAGPNGAASVTAGSFASIAADDNLLAVWFSTSATNPLDGAWTAEAGGAAYAGSENLSGGVIYVAWFDKSAAA